METFTRKLTDFLSSRRFWYVVFGFFIFEALWLVFSAVYPMAFDEDFHLGVIRMYAEQWSPFLTAHPQTADQFGAVVRDPSYLYHYLMSFPYRILVYFTGTEAMQVVILRLMNVAMFAAGLALFRKVMLRAGASAALTHGALALFVLIPIVPQLAAHINYDNLLMILLPLMCLAVFSLTDSFRKRQINTQALLGFVAICLFMSVVKYAVLPFLAAALLFLAAVFAWRFKGHFNKAGPGSRAGFIAMRRPLQIGLLGLCLLGGVLFMQRYGVNMVQYKTPVPDCGQVLSAEQCSAYGPWGRDYYFEQVKSIDFSPDPNTYMAEWVKGMWYRLFFAVNGPTSAYTNYRPLPVPYYTAIVLAGAGLLTVLIWWRKVFRGNTYLLFFALLIAVYCVILWLDQYGMYKDTAQPVAINGRYLLPILPLLAVIIGRGLAAAASALRATRLKAVLCVAILLLFLHGGGFFTFILRSDNTWYWPSQPVRALNNQARDVLAPVIIEGPK